MKRFQKFGVAPSPGVNVVRLAVAEMEAELEQEENEKMKKEREKRPENRSAEKNMEDGSWVLEVEHQQMSKTGVGEDAVAGHQEEIGQRQVRKDSQDVQMKDLTQEESAVEVSTSGCESSGGDADGLDRDGKEHGHRSMASNHMERKPLQKQNASARVKASNEQRNPDPLRQSQRATFPPRFLAVNA